MGCGCNKEKPKGGGKSFTKAVVEIVNPEKITLLRKVVIPASLGDETTIPPAVGLYRNVVLCYEASKKVYLYSSDGIPTFISTDLDAIEDELERLGVAIEDETIAREQADEELREDISGLSEALAEETLARISGDDQINDTVSAHTLQISELSTGLNDEIDNRRNADTDLQSQIDAISASSDVKDIVGTHAELENYDTTHLGDNDIIKVLQDETQDGATTYYRWSTATQEFTLIGEEGPYYTKSQTDGLLTGKQNVLTAGNNITITGDTISATDTTYSAGNGLLLNGTTFSADTTILQPRLTAGDNVSISNNTISATDTKYTAGSGLDLTGTEFSIDNTVALKTDLPTVNNAIFTVQKNGADVASFTANSAVDVTANITVPTDTAQLTNTAGYQTASDVASAISGKQDTLTPGNNIQINGNTISATNTTYSAGNGLDLTGTVFSADTDILQTKLTPGTNITIQDGVISSAGGTYTAGNGLELTNNEFSIDDSIVALKSDIPIISSASLTIQRNGTDVATFTTDSPNPVTANILVPTNNAQLINGAGYQTASDVQSLISGKQDTLTPGNNIQISGNTISATDTKYSAGNGLNLTGTVFTADTDILATKSYVDSVVPEDMVVLSYGNSTWNDFITAYNDNRVVYCRASSNADPSTGSQTRLAFMAYVNNGTNPTNVEFQYYRSVSSHSDSQQGDQVYVYKLESNGTWTVTVRNAFSKVIAGNNMTSSYSNGAITLNATVPTDVSELNNDAGYITNTVNNLTNYTPTSSLATVATSGSYNDLINTPVIPTKTSDLTNDSGFITNTDYATASTGGVVKVGSGLQITNGVLSATGGGVADAVEWANVLNKPTDVSYWNNDAGYLTSVSWGEVSGKPTFATVATSGSYNDLSDKPSIPAAQVNSDWNASSGVAQILNKPTLATVATSGSYNDLSNKPTIPAAQVNSDWNATGGVAEILNKPTIPTKTSDLTNDSGYITDAGVTSFNGQTGAVTYTAPVTSVNGNTGDVTIAVPTKTSDLINDGSDNTAQYLETDETAYRTMSIPYGECDSTSTSTAFTATVPGITELRDGVCVLLKNGVVTSAANFTVDINGLGAKPVYSSMAAATRETTVFNINYTLLFVYDSDRVSGGCWINYRGYYSDSNSIGYQLRTNSSTLPAKQTGYRYRLWLTSPDGQNYVPINVSTSTSTTGTKALNTAPIDPFGTIVYNSTNGTVNANANLPTGTQWTQYAVDLRYSKYPLTLTFPDPVYLQCTPQNDGSAVMNDIVQALPTTEDGKIYIYLGNAYSATNIELKQDHPVYYYKDGMVRPYTNPAAQRITVDTELSSTSENPVQNKVINSALGSKANSADLSTVATSGSYNDLTNKPTIPAAQVNSDWNSNSGVSQILNKPTLATVATSGSYNDLSNKPTIPTVPTNVSAFTNDAGYQNSTQVQTAINSAISGITGFEYQVVQALPATGEKGVIYLVPNSGSAPNIYDEYIWIESGQSGSFEKIGTTETDLSGYVTDGELQTALADYTTTEDLATVATSGSYNDLSNKPTIPAAQVNSDWNASSGVAQILNKPTLATVATSGSYNDLSNKPTIPTVNNATLTIQKNGTTVKTFTANASSNVTANITVPTATSDLTNDSGFITGVAWGDVTGKPTFATVATTGSYDDLEDKPTIPAAQVNADWNATSGVAQILNKPTIPTVPSAGTTASAVSTTASGGSATTWSKSDHVHSISSSTITSALGYTPYNSTNPNGYTSNTGTITGVSANGTSVATSGVANIPAASTSRYGVTQLSTATNSSSTSLAATPSAVKAAYDLANGKQDPLTAGTGIDITNGVISATAVANTFASYQNGTLYITNSAQNADTENF